MNSQKQKVVEHCEASLNWINDLKNISEAQWRMPVAEGKWTIAEVIGHLIPWDEYFIKRIPYLINDQEVPGMPDIEKVNHQASVNSQQLGQEELIQDVVRTREKLLSQIREIDDELWRQDLNGRESVSSLVQFLSRLIDHDHHHFAEIKKVLN